MGIRASLGCPGLGLIVAPALSETGVSGSGPYSECELAGLDAPAGIYEHGNESTTRASTSSPVLFLCSGSIQHVWQVVGPRILDIAPCSW